MTSEASKEEQRFEGRSSEYYREMEQPPRGYYMDRPMSWYGDYRYQQPSWREEQLYRFPQYDDRFERRPYDNRMYDNRMYDSRMYGQDFYGDRYQREYFPDHQGSDWYQGGYDYPRERYMPTPSTYSAPMIRTYSEPQTIISKTTTTTTPTAIPKERISAWTENKSHHMHGTYYEPLPPAKPAKVKKEKAHGGFLREKEYKYGPEHCHYYGEHVGYLPERQYIDRGTIVEQRAYPEDNYRYQREYLPEYSRREPGHCHEHYYGAPMPTPAPVTTSRMKEGYVVAELPGGRIIETPVQKEKTAYEKEIESRIQTYTERKPMKHTHVDTWQQPVTQTTASTGTTSSSATTAPVYVSKTLPSGAKEVIETKTTTTTSPTKAPATARAM